MLFAPIMSGTGPVFHCAKPEAVPEPSGAVQVILESPALLLALPAIVMVGAVVPALLDAGDVTVKVGGDAFTGGVGMTAVLVTVNDWLARLPAVSEALTVIVFVPVASGTAAIAQDAPPATVPEAPADVVH